MASASSTSGECSMDNGLQALLTLLSLLAAVVQVITAFCNAATAASLFLDGEVDLNSTTPLSAGH